MSLGLHMSLRLNILFIGLWKLAFKAPETYYDTVILSIHITLLPTQLIPYNMNCGENTCKFPRLRNQYWRTMNNTNEVIK